MAALDTLRYDGYVFSWMTRRVIGLLSVMLMTAPLVTAGCVALDGSPAPATTHGRLTNTAWMRLDRGASVLEVTARPAGGGAPQRLALRLRDGHLSLRAATEDTLVIEELALELEDVVVDAATAPPAGLHATNLSVTLPAALEASAAWSPDDGTLAADVSATLELDWALITPDDDYVPLGPQRLAVELTVEVRSDPARGMVARVRGGRAGLVLAPDGVVELDDLGLDLVAAP